MSIEERDGVVYAAICLEGDELEDRLIKIGCTTDPDHRMDEDPYEIIMTRPDRMRKAPDTGWRWLGHLEGRILEFATRHGLRHELNDPEFVKVTFLRSGSTELVRFDDAAIEEWSELAEDADYDVKRFIEDLLALHEQGDVYPA